LPKNARQAVAGELISWERPDDEKITSVPSGGVDETTRLRYGIDLVAAAWTRFDQRQTSCWRSPAASARDDQLEQTGWMSLVLLGERNFSRSGFESGYPMFVEKIQHSPRNQYVVRPSEGEILYDRRMNDDRQFTDTLPPAVMTISQRANDSLIPGVASLLASLCSTRGSRNQNELMAATRVCVSASYSIVQRIARGSAYHAP
jgi:hypothetical protein